MKARIEMKHNDLSVLILSLVHETNAGLIVLVN